jgi:hypothetical protein
VTELSRQHFKLLIDPKRYWIPVNRSEDDYELLCLERLVSKIRLQLEGQSEKPGVKIGNFILRWHSWLRRCTISRKVAGSIPHGARVLISP